MNQVEASAAVAAESSTGTWTEVRSNQLTDLNFYKAKVYRIVGGIACPMDLFEENSVVNIVSLIVIGDETRRRCRMRRANRVPPHPH